MKLFIFILVAVPLFAQDPYWLYDPTMNGKYVGAIGCAKDINNTTLQKNKAILQAKGSLSQTINTQITDEQSRSITVSDELFEEEFNVKTTQTTSSTFTVKKMADYYNNGTYCVWLIKL